MKPWTFDPSSHLTIHWSHVLGRVVKGSGLGQQSVEGEHHEKAVELLKAAQGSVKLVVRYTPRVLEEMEARFEKMRSARRRQQHHSYS